MLTWRRIFVVAGAVLMLTVSGCRKEPPPPPPPVNVNFPPELRFAPCIEDEVVAEQFRRQGLVLRECKAWIGLDFPPNYPMDRLDEVRVELTFADPQQKPPEIIAFEPHTTMGRADDVSRIRETAQRVEGNLAASAGALQAYWEQASSGTRETWAPYSATIAEASREDKGAGVYWKFMPGPEQTLVGERQFCLMVAWPTESPSPGPATMKVKFYADKKTEPLDKIFAAVPVKLVDPVRRESGEPGKLGETVKRESGGNVALALFAFLLVVGALVVVVLVIHRVRKRRKDGHAQYDVERRT